MQPHATPAPDDDGPDGETTVISGAYQLWNEPLHPFFRELPSWHVMRADQRTHLEPVSLAVALLSAEAGRRKPGAELVLHGLLDVLFTYLLRELLARHTGDAGFVEAQRDPAVRHVVELMHGDCARPWTLEELARAAGLSRTLLAERFRKTMGDTPLSYLRTVRLQKAVRLLSDTDRKLADVATEVGYQDAFGFSKAFKRVVGESPAEFRRRDAGDRCSPFRFRNDESMSAPPPRS